MAHKEISGVDNINPNKFGGMCSRAVPILTKGVDFEKGIETIATTDAPALVVDWERWEVIREVLPMRYCEMPTNGKVPLLDSHRRESIDKIKGSASDFRTSENQLLCKTFISKSENIVREKIQEGHIDSVSIGYRTSPDYTVEVPKKATVMIDGVVYKNEYEDDYPLVVRTWWKSHELSLVPIGADEAAKFKAEGNHDAMKKVLDELAQVKKELAEMKAKNKPEEEIKQLETITKERIALRMAIMKHELTN